MITKETRNHVAAGSRDCLWPRGAAWGHAKRHSAVLLLRSVRCRIGRRLARAATFKQFLCLPESLSDRGHLHAQKR
jgi:hypothetical protein